MTAGLAVPEVGLRLPPIRRDRPVHVWVAAATASAAGDAVLTLALAWTAVHLYSAALAGVIISVETLPQALLTLAGGVLADRVDTRRLLILGEGARAVLLLGAAAAWSVDRSAAVLLVLALGFGVVAGLTNPARGTLSRQLVRDDDLPVIAGWNQIGTRLAQLSGGPLGAIVVATGGLGPAMLVDAGTFGLTAAALLAVVRPRRQLRANTPEPWRTSLRALRHYLATDRVARALTWGVCSLNVVVTPVETVGVALRVSRSHWAAGWVGAAGACCAVGAVLGSAWAIRWRGGRRAGRAFRTLVVQGVALAAVGVPNRASLLVAMALLGVTAGLASVWLSSAFVTSIAGTHLGRVTSVSQLGDQLAVPVALPVFGLLAQRAGVWPATAVFGTAMACWCAAIGSRHAIRSLE